jgi:hypothetical protein
VSEFQPIESQEQLDQIIRKRLKEEKDLQAEADNLRAEIEAKNKEMATLKAEHTLETELVKRGITDPARQARIKRLVDTADESEPVSGQLDALESDLPELMRGHLVGARSGGSSKPVLEPKETPLTEEDISKMGPEEMTRPGVMERIDQFMRGAR